jgi:catechol 2,3-dioxygenase-like lactoylglutathione lyase family enzyme
MRRLHVSLTVDDLDASIRFYTTLFGAEPTVRKPDYAKWMLEDPRVNFAVDTGVGASGVSHLGIQSETPEELEATFARVAAAGGASVDEGETTCCYARSTKQWITDPEGVAWETFLTHEDAPVHGRKGPAAAAAVPVGTGGGCCA